MTENPQFDLWEPVEIPAGKHLHYQLGSLSLRVESNPAELRLHSTRLDRPIDGCSSGIEDSIPSDVGTIERFACHDDTPRVKATPVLPDRSVVVRPEHQLTVLPGEQALFFVGIPVWVRFELIRAKPVMLKTFPSVIRSGTWYGDQFSGESCYLEKGPAQRSLENLTLRDWQIVCPITIHNRAKTGLDIVRVCIQVSHLGVFQGRQHLWTQPVGIINREGSSPLSATYDQKPSEWEPILKTLSEPRDPVQKSLLGRGLSSLRLPGF